MALLSQSQSDNMETIVARIKKQALEAQHNSTQLMVLL